MTADPFAMDAQEAAAFLSGGGEAAKWPAVGTEVGGTIRSFRMAQQTDMETGELETWKDGRPRMQLVVDLQCEPTGINWKGLENEQYDIPDDDGMRTAYVKGELQKAISKAIKDAGGKFETGAYVRIRRITNGPKTNPKFAAPHRYIAKWTPAAQNPQAGAQDFMKEGETAKEDPWASAPAAPPAAAPARRAPAQAAPVDDDPWASAPAAPPAPSAFAGSAAAPFGDDEPPF
jgi:hypothetical protein